MLRIRGVLIHEEIFRFVRMRGKSWGRSARNLKIKFTLQQLKKNRSLNFF